MAMGTSGAKPQPLTALPPPPHTHANFAHAQAKTHKVSGSTSPKFLMDLRLEVPHPKTDCLTLELLQAGPRGDLVVGCAEVSIAPLADQGTLVHWFPLSNAAQRVGAELCVVLRYAPSEWPAGCWCSSAGCAVRSCARGQGPPTNAPIAPAPLSHITPHCRTTAGSRPATPYSISAHHAEGAPAAPDTPDEQKVDRGCQACLPLCPPFDFE